METKVIVKHIEQQVEGLLYRKNELLRRATNGVDYSLDEATCLMREQWLQYTERVDSIEDQVVESFPILNSVRVNVNRTISEIEEIKLRPMWANKWPNWWSSWASRPDGLLVLLEWTWRPMLGGGFPSYWLNKLDELLHALTFYRDDPDGLNEEIARSCRMELLLCLNPEEREALSNNQLDRIREPFRRRAAPLPPYGFPNIYQMMKDLRYTCEHWDVLAANWEDDVGLDLCQDVLTTPPERPRYFAPSIQAGASRCDSSRASKTRQNAETYLI